MTKWIPQSMNPRTDSAKDGQTVAIPKGKSKKLKTAPQNGRLKLKIEQDGEKTVQKAQ